MAFVCRWILLLTVLLAPVAAVCAEAPPTEKGLFTSATSAFNDQSYDWAEKHFAEFTRTFTNSALLPEAILYQARVRLKQTNYAGAGELLARFQPQAGRFSDQYVFWLAETSFQKGDYKTAAESFDKLVQQFPSSSNRLEAAVRQATALGKLFDWPRVLSLLEQTNGVFQSTARTNAGSEHVVRGYLLLGEARFAQSDFAGALAALQPLAKLRLDDAPAWQWQYLLCRIQLATGKPEEALQSTTNLLTVANRSTLRDLQAESAAFKAGVLERLGRVDEAIAAYTNNLAAGVPPESQRHALLRITLLSLAQNRVPEAMQMLKDFLVRFPGAPAADRALLTLGELQLSEYAQGRSPKPEPRATNAITTNYLQQAIVSFESLAKSFPQSGFFGKSQLDLGWCFWLTNRLPESQRALQAAVERLPVSADLATAYFKLADAQFQQNDFTNAITNYAVIKDKLADLPEVKTNLLERALYQLVRAALAGGNIPAATSALERLLTWFPNGFHTERAVLLAGQQIDSPAKAREIYLDFLKRAPQASLRPEVELAIGRTFEQENKWVDAIRQYQSWLSTFTNHTARPLAVHQLGLACFYANDKTNALTCFNYLIAQFPTNDLAPRAQWWIADYYFNAGDLTLAEKDYQLVFKNWKNSELAFPAYMMAGRVAVQRSSWEDAWHYLTNLTGNASCPADLRAEALYALGGYWMSHNSTNKLADYDQAISIFNQISQDYPSTPQAVLAWGEKANCFLQRGLFTQQYEEAIKAFQHLIADPNAHVTARSQAKVGLGIVLEKQADQPGTADKSDGLRRQALNHYLDVLYGILLREGEKIDPFWAGRAGLEAARVAEALQEWPQAVKIYERIEKLVPTLSASVDKRRLKALEKVDARENALR